MAKKSELSDDPLVKELDHELVLEFFDDFSSLVFMIRSLGAAWAEADNELYAAIDVFREYVDKFNEKYSGLIVKFENTTDQGFRLFIFFPKEKNLVDIFSNAAGKIQGLTKIGTDTASAVPPTMENIREVLGHAKNKLVMIYTRGSSTSIILEFDKKAKMPELIFDLNNIAGKDVPEFLICAYYAVRDMKSEMDIKPIKLKFPSIAISPNVENVGPLKG